MDRSMGFSRLSDFSKHDYLTSYYRWNIPGRAISPIRKPKICFSESASFYLSICSTTYVLTDFGAARALDEEETFTSIYGTEEYLVCFYCKAAFSSETAVAERTILIYEMSVKWGKIFCPKGTKSLVPKTVFCNVSVSLLGGGTFPIKKKPPTGTGVYTVKFLY